jgi:hypothetical protein
MLMQRVPLIVCALSAVVLAACGGGQPNDQQPTPSAAAQDQSSAPAVQAGHYHAALALVGRPEVSVDGKNVIVTVNVTNDGSGSFGTQATPDHNVNLGAHSIDATGKVLDNDLARGTMPEVAPGAIVKATILLPLDKVLGNRAELLPVAEGVAWFDTWGTKPLIVGPFVACGDTSTGKVCDGQGKPLPTAH